MIFSNIKSLYLRTKVNDVFVLVTQVQMLRSDHVRSQSLTNCHTFNMPYHLKRLVEYERSKIDLSEGQLFFKKLSKISRK